MSRVPSAAQPFGANAVASTSTAHLGSTGVRHRQHDKEVTDSHSVPSLRRLDVPSAEGSFRRKRRGRNGRSGSKSRGLRWRKGLVSEAFRQFGEHCARNQIRTLLIDCLVMTNLFYPSLALYLQKRFPPLRPPSQPTHNSHRTPFYGQTGHSRRYQKEHPLSLLSTPILDSFFPYPPPLLPRLTWAGWWGRDTGQLDEEGWTVTRVPLDEKYEESHPGLEEDEEIQIMRIAWADVEDVLDRDVEAGERAWDERDHVLLRLVSEMAEDWEQQYPSSRQRCVRRLEATSAASNVSPTGPCYILSPTNTTQDAVSLVPLPSMSLPDRNSLLFSDQINTASFANAGNIYHSFAFLFRIPRNTTTDFENAWQNRLADVARTVKGEAFGEARGPRTGTDDQTGRWIVSFASAHSPDRGTTLSDSTTETHAADLITSSPPKVVLFLYGVLFVTLIAQLSNASKVHSRFGLAFTGVVQLCCSSVMSFSVLALLGWNGWGASQSESSLPTYVLPFVIVVVGAENMSTLTKAIFSIPFTHSVPARIGLGLSKVGSTIALTSLTDLIVLGVVWLCFNLQPVREFCLFAAVVIITDWFMLHTFFLTVLSIDAQRLELADVLASNKVGPTSPTSQEAETETSSDGKNGFSWRNVLRARTTKSGSLILLLMTVGLLYWLTERHRSPANSTAVLYGYTPSSSPTSAASLPSSSSSPFSTTASVLALLTPAERLWRAINPQGWPFSRIIVPAASIIVLPKQGHPMLPADIRKLSLSTRRLLLPRLKPLFYLFKVVVLPQALTAGLLYTLLLFLLKDADLLDAQRDRLGRGDDRHSDDTDEGSAIDKSGANSLASSLKAHMLPCSHESDIDIIAPNSDGQMMVSVGVNNSLCLWRFQDRQNGCGTREPLQASVLAPDDPVMGAAVSSDNRHVAVCTSAGHVQVWEVPPDGPVVAQPLRKVAQISTARVIGLAFDDTDGAVHDPFTAATVPVDYPRQDPVILVAFSSGSVVAVTDQRGSATVIPPQNIGGGSPCRVFFMRAEKTLSIVIAGQHDLDIWRKMDTVWSSTHIASGLSTDDRITSVSDAVTNLPGLVALGHRSGCIDIYDEPHGLVVSIGQSVSLEGIRKVGIVKPPYVRCSGCGQQTSDGYLVVSSTPSQVFVDRIAPRSPIGSLFCRCTRRGSSMDDPAIVTAVPYTPRKGSLSGNGKKKALVVPPSLARKRYSPGTSPKRSPSLLAPISNGEFPLSSHGGARRLSNLHRDDESNFGAGNGINVNGGSSNNSTLKGRPASPMGTSFPSSDSSGSATSPGAEMDVTPLGAISSPDGGGWELLTKENILFGIRRASDGIDDGQWQCWMIDLTCPSNGTTLVVQTIDMVGLISKTYLGVGTRVGTASGGGDGISMRDRRTERLHSLNGRAVFPERVGSFSVATYDALGYVGIREMVKMGGNGSGPTSVIAGFGNRLGLFTFDLSPQRERTIKARSSFEHSHGQQMGLLGLGGTPTPRRSGFPLTPPPPPSTRKMEMMDLGMSGVTPGNGTGTGHDGVGKKNE
ncbi:hypothetical protein IAR55_002380 [Kwoniella newhampshirensis]|uniref:Sterol regulatory element-binding protein cleavage-activating protein n=1 Tax=Kwoniella newhampshirensis TaxID=1651941 RepID=A0AAW0YQW3_9TREE